MRDNEESSTTRSWSAYLSQVFNDLNDAFEEYAKETYGTSEPKETETLNTPAKFAPPEMAVAEYAAQIPKHQSAFLLEYEAAPPAMQTLTANLKNQLKKANDPRQGININVVITLGKMIDSAIQQLTPLLIKKTHLFSPIAHKAPPIALSPRLITPSSQPHHHYDKKSARNGVNMMAILLAIKDTIGKFLTAIKNAGIELHTFIKKNLAKKTGEFKAMNVKEDKSSPAENYPKPTKSN